GPLRHARRQRTQHRIDRRPGGGLIGALIAVTKMERTRVEILCLRPCSFGRGPVIKRVLRLERRGELELLVDDRRNRIRRRQRERAAQTAVQERNLLVLAIEIGRQRFHVDAPSVLPWKTLLLPSRSRIE